MIAAVLIISSGTSIDLITMNGLVRNARDHLRVTGREEEEEEEEEEEREEKERERERER